VATACRALGAVDAEALARIQEARAGARAAAWVGGADPGFYVIDIDGMLIDADSDKQHAAPTYKHGFGFYPLLAYLDATGEALAGLLRPGNAGSAPPLTTSTSWMRRWRSRQWTPPSSRSSAAPTPWAPAMSWPRPAASGRCASSAG
jgi:hypothetical protein